MTLHPLQCITASLLLAASLGGCASGARAEGETKTPAFAIDQEVVVEGRVASVDTTPWTYDGNAIVVVDSTSYGRVKAQLPARWNLCKAPGIGEAAQLKVGDRVRIAGTATDPDVISVCEQPGHRLERL